MSLYGYSSQPLVTVVAAALNKLEFSNFYNHATDLNIDKYMSDIMQHLTDPDIQPFSSSVIFFHHVDVQQQQEFIEKHEILMGSHQRSVDRHTDMLNWDTPDPWLDVNETRTIEQITGLDVFDSWDRRTDQQRSDDQQMKKMMDEMKKKGQLSNDDSFASPQLKDSNGELIVTDIRTTVNSDGSVNVNNVLAVKLDENSTNAVLKMVFGNKTVRTDVQWNQHSLQGSQGITDAVYGGSEYREQWESQNQPVFTVTTRDGLTTSAVQHQVLTNTLTAVHGLTILGDNPTS